MLLRVFFCLLPKLLKDIYKRDLSSHTPYKKIDIVAVRHYEKDVESQSELIEKTIKISIIIMT